MNILIIELFVGLILIWTLWIGGALLLLVKIPSSAALAAAVVLLISLMPLILQIITLVYVKPCKRPQMMHLDA